MNRAVILDRDGVINRERGTHTWRIADFRFVDGVIRGLSHLQERGYLLIVVTNQSGIARGMYTHEDVRTLHNYMRNELLLRGVEIEEVYYCPHHESVSNCLCRKPGSLLIEKAVARFELDTDASFAVGDAARDVQAAESAGLRGFQIPANSSLVEFISQTNCL